MKTDITKDGQEYVYEEKRTPIYGSKEPIYISEGYERVRLVWKKPLRDANGEFVHNADGSIKLVPR